MVEETEFKAALKDINHQKCAFAKIVLNRKAGCEYAQKILLAEREGMNCISPTGLMLCQQWTKYLQEKCLFALKIDDLSAELPHGKAVKLQLGGLIGLHNTLHDSPPEIPISNIVDLLQQAKTAFDQLDKIPLEHIIPAISAYQNKTRSRRKR